MQDSIATTNAEVDTGSIRVESHRGRDHLVAPVVAVREMVLKGEFLPAEEIRDSVPAWNGRVLPVGHPTNDEDEFISANSPDVHDTNVVGQFFGAEESEGSLIGEVWVDVDRSLSLHESTGDERYVKALAVLSSHYKGDLSDEVGANLATHAEDGDMLEVSTAYFYRQESAMGTHDGQKYSATQHNIRPDHLALLPNSKGECSVEDGCGAPRVHVHADVSDGQQGEPTEQDDEAQQKIANYGTMTENMEWLASHTEFDRETLESFEDSHLETLKASVEAAGESDDCGCSGDGEPQDAQNDSDSTGSAGSESDEEVPSAVEEEITAMREEIEALRSERHRAESESAAERIVSNSTSFEDTEAVFDSFGEDPETLETLASELEERNAQAGVDFTGRVGANADPSGSDDDTDDYVALAKRANSARFGEPEESE